jgi:hypothetical protein
MNRCQTCKKWKTARCEERKQGRNSGNNDWCYAYKAKLVKPLITPRYDKVYREGVEWLDSLAEEDVEIEPDYAGQIAERKAPTYKERAIEEHGCEIREARQ